MFDVIIELLHRCDVLIREAEELMKKEKVLGMVQYDPDMPCNKKGCDAQTRASCCGCPEQLEYERKKKSNEEKVMSE